RFAAFLGVVAGQRVRVIDEEIGYSVGIAAGAAQAHNLPDVLDLREFAAKQHGPFASAAIGIALRCAIRLKAGTMRAEPCRMAAAAGEGPVASDTPPALGADRLGTRAHAPGKHVTLPAENLACGFRP